jgi:Fe-S oxidoreductase
MTKVCHIACITQHYYPDTIKHYELIMKHLGIEWQINETLTCCGLPYFEKGELSAAKTIAEQHLSNLNQVDLICHSSKCQATFSEHYHHIFNNTALHLEANAMIKRVKSIYDILPALLPQLKSDIAHYYWAGNCCQSSANQFYHQLQGIKWSEAPMGTSCCGAGTSLAAIDPLLSSDLSEQMVNDFKQSGATCMVFEDDICRKQIDAVAQSKGISIATYNLIDIIAKRIA